MSRKLPKANLYEAQIDKVTYVRDVPPPEGKNWNKTNKLTLIFKLLGTKDDNDGERDFSVFVFQNVSYNVHFERDGSKSLTKAGAILRNIFGDVPYPLKSEEVDWEALQGCYAGVFVQDGPKNSKGEVYANITAFSSPSDEEHLKFNQDRLELIYKGRK